MNMNEAKVKAKQMKNDAGCKIRCCFDNMIFWVEEHPKATAVIVTLSGYAVKAIVLHTKHEKVNFEKQKVERMVWDPQMGVWWECKSKMTQADKIRLAELLAQGYSRCEALKEMGKLK